MKIGIVTVHRAYNYGSVLQCYALQEYLKLLEHEVQVIDYRQPWTEAVYSVFSWRYVWHFLKKKDLHAIVGYWRSRSVRKENLKKAKEVFASFMQKLQTTKECSRFSIPQDFDVYVVGSDQLWNHVCVGGEDPVYQGYFKRPKDGKLIGFSLSASVQSYYLLGERKLKKIISRFNKISLREQTGVDIVKELTDVQLPVTLDPTLLCDASIWKPMINHKWQDKKYVAVYQARDVAGEPNYLINKAHVLADAKGWDVIDLSGMTYTVEDFISVIACAQYVFTTSFHATVFSVLMSVPCFAIQLNDGFDLRYVDLLKSLGLESEIFPKDFTPSPFSVDFSLVQQRLVKYREETIKFLESI